MSKAPIPFALPDISDDEIAEVVSCLKSGWLTTGPKVKAFETAFCDYLNDDVHAVAVSSATEGLLIALKACGIGEGDEVITTCNTFSATAMSIYHAGATPILVDIDATTMNMDVAQVEAAITKKTKAIMPVHMAGLACDMDALFTLAKKHQLKIIEDAAHALPTLYKGKLVGALESDATVFSFYATKTITTGEGGMIVSKHKDIIEKAKPMRLHGISRDVFDRYTSPKAGWYYEVTCEGYKSNMSDIAASIGLVQLRKADKFRARRAKIAAYYHEALKDLPLSIPTDASPDSMHAWHLYVIQVNHPSKSRDDIIQTLKEDYQIGCSVHFIPLHHHSFWQHTLGVKPGDFPVADKVFASVISLPIYTKMTDEQVEHVAMAVREVIGS